MMRVPSRLRLLKLKRCLKWTFLVLCDCFVNKFKLAIIQVEKKTKKAKKDKIFDFLVIYCYCYFVQRLSFHTVRLFFVGFTSTGAWSSKAATGVCGATCTEFICNRCIVTEVI